MLCEQCGTYKLCRNDFKFIYNAEVNLKRKSQKLCFMLFPPLTSVNQHFLSLFPEKQNREMDYLFRVRFAMYNLKN